MPVPTTGASGFINGTLWRCIFDPIKALFASSCSKNGINEAATDKIWFGATSIYSIFAGETIGKSPLILALIWSLVNFSFFPSSGSSD